MTQDPVLQITLAAERIDQTAIRIPGDGIDGQVPSRQVFFQRDPGVKINRKAMVTMALFAFGAGQRVLLTGVGMQKNRERCSDLAKAPGKQFLRLAAHHNPVPLLWDQPK